MTEIDHKKILADRISARLGRRTVLKGLGAGLVTAGSRWGACRS